MAEYLLNESGLFVSKRRQTDLLTPYTAGADFARMTTRNPGVVLPQMGKLTDAGRAGNATEFEQTVCNTYWDNPAISIAERADFDMMGRLLLRAHGHTVTDTTLGTGAYKHSSPMVPRATGLDLPGSTVINEIGPASYLYPGMVVNRFRMEQSGVDPVVCTVDFVGIGKHRSPHAVTSLPTVPGFGCPRPGINLSYTDTGGLKDVGALDCSLKGWFIELTNGINPPIDRCNNDPVQAADDWTVTTGASVAAYNQKLRRGNRQINAEFTFLLTDTFPYQQQMASNEVITGLTMGAKGALLTGSIYEALNFVVPAARFGTTIIRDADGRAAVVLSIVARYSSSVNGASRGEVINSIVSNYD